MWNWHDFILLHAPMPPRPWIESQDQYVVLYHFRYKSISSEKWNASEEDAKYLCWCHRPGSSISMLTFSSALISAIFRSVRGLKPTSNNRGSICQMLDMKSISSEKGNAREQITSFCVTVDAIVLLHVNRVTTSASVRKPRNGQLCATGSCRHARV